MRSNLLSKTVLGAVCALILSAIFPAAAIGQRRWRERPYRSRIVVVSNYQRPYAVYQRRPRYRYQSYSYGTYPQGYYGSQYSTYDPGYTNRYYSYRYSQPYFANRSTYAWTNPTYRYDESWHRQRHRRRGLRIGIRLR